MSKDKPPFEQYDRRLPPPLRDVVLNEADRTLARVILQELKKHLGIKDIAEWQEEQKLLKEILPMLQTMHEAYKWRAQLFKWWLTTMGKTILWGGTTFLLLALIYGASPAFRVVISKVSQ